MLSQNYEIINAIAKTAHSEIYVVQHKILNEKRIAKIVKKSSDGSERILKEAHFIKLFKHPGIPLIYDIMEDNDSICIIEEYIAGKSLTEYMIEQGNIAFSQIIDYGIQICNILEYMHNFNGSGVIHMDLKPDNILIDGYNNVRIIDFDNSVYLGQYMEQSYGSIGFAAPEQYHRLKPDYTSDIYGLGMLLLYMANNGCIQSNADNERKLTELQSQKLNPIIRKCIRHNAFQRFRTIESVRKELVNIKSDTKKSKRSDFVKSHNIYVYGAKRGIGTTHFCLCLASYISRNNYKVVCVGNNVEDDLVSEAIKGVIASDGTYFFKGVHFIPHFCTNITYDMEKYSFVIHDCGVIDATVENRRDDEIVILVTDIGYKRKLEDKIISNLRKNVVVVINHMEGKEFYKYLNKSNADKKCVRMPCMYNWYEENEIFNMAAWDILGEYYKDHFFGKISGKMHINIFSIIKNIIAGGVKKGKRKKI